MSMLKRLAVAAVAPFVVAACGDNGDPSLVTSNQNAPQPRAPLDAPSLPTGASTDAPRGPLPPRPPAESPAPPRMMGVAPADVTPPPDCHGATCSDCGEGRYCDLVDSGHCDDRSAPGYCRAKLVSVMCPMIFEPVCGCDGNTYANTCERMRAGVALDFGGPCQGTTNGTTSAP